MVTVSGNHTKSLIRQPGEFPINVLDKRLHKWTKICSLIVIWRQQALIWYCMHCKKGWVKDSRKYYQQITRQWSCLVFWCHALSPPANSVDKIRPNTTNHPSIYYEMLLFAFFGLFFLSLGLKSVFMINQCEIKTVHFTSPVVAISLDLAYGAKHW